VLQAQRLETRLLPPMQIADADFSVYLRHIECLAKRKMSCVVH